MNMQNIQNMIINNSNIKNKIDALFLKLKFLNFDKKKSKINILNFNNIDDDNNNIDDDNDIINDINNSINFEISNENIDFNNIINQIDNIIEKIDKKIICKGQIKRQKKIIDFEYF